MILLSGHSLTPARRIPLEHMQLTLTERDSSAVIEPAETDGIGMNSWMQDDTEPGKGIVWRVKSIGETMATGITKVNLEHAIGILKDQILFGEYKPPQITGNKSATTCTAEQAIRFILSKQSDWELGACEYTDSNPYKFDGDTLYDALEKVSDSLDECWWEYDFRKYPFKVSFRKKSTALGSVLRAGRNLVSLNRSIEKSGMYTRFYPIGKDDLHLDGEYVSRNEGTYGRKDKTETDQTITMQEELRRWAEERLKKHAEPVVTIDVTALELADATGEPLDKLVLGRMCRIHLKEFGAEITETIEQISYQDKKKEPGKARITLANKKTDATKIIADAIKKGGGGGRAAARQQKEDHAWFEDTNDHVAMCAEGIVGVDAQGNPNWIRLSQIIANENGIESSVRGVQEGLEIANTKIRQTENAITLEANRAQNAESSLSGRLTVANNKIGLVVTEKNGRNVVNSASIVAGINDQSGSYVKIKAQTIDLAGYVTASQLSATNAKISNLETGSTKATFLKAYSMAADSFSVNSSGFRVSNHTATWKYVEYMTPGGSAASIYVLGRT